MFWWNGRGNARLRPDEHRARDRHRREVGVPTLDSTEGFRNVIAAASSGGLLMIIIGILVMAGEFRFNTVTSTFLITPDRKRVTGAKLDATSLVGLCVGVVASRCPWQSLSPGSQRGTLASARTLPTSWSCCSAGSRDGPRRSRRSRNWLAADQPNARDHRHPRLDASRREPAHKLEVGRRSLVPGWRGERGQRHLPSARLVASDLGRGAPPDRLRDRLLRPREPLCLAARHHLERNRNQWKTSN